MSGNPADNRLLAFIRRVNLDMIWSREPKTKEGYRSAYNKAVKADAYLGLEPSFPSQGLWKVGENMGFQVALEMLVASRWKGKYYDDRQKFDTIHTIQTLYSNLFESSSYACNDIGMFRDSKG